MPEHRRQHPEDEDPLVDEQERGSADEQSEDEDLDEKEDDQDPNAERDLIADVGFTGEVGSEGGSRGDVEVERRRPRVMRGSESTTTGTADEDSTFKDRKSGPGY